MICILSQSFHENTTEDVMHWLRHWGVECCRLNADDLTRADGTVVEIRNGEMLVNWESNGRRICASDVEVVWFRRWTRSDVLELDPPDFLNDQRGRRFNLLSCSSHLRGELHTVSQAVFASFARALWVNHPRYTAVNKLEVLQLAQRCGLAIPATLVTADPQRVREFASTHSRVITKCANNMSVFRSGDRLAMPPTTEIDTESPSFQAWQGRFPSLFQERLQRAYEIRIFFLDGDCFASAYVFDEDAARISDGRIAKGRTTPFQLPEDLRQRLSDLMSRLGLNLGCIDMVRTQDDRWVFLEVNPNGQFWADGCICHYRLEKRIAEALVRRLDEVRGRTH